MRLLEPLALGGYFSPNRVMFGPHETNLGDGRRFSSRHVAYYERRAAGGAGIIVTEEASVHESDYPYERAPLAEDCGPGWRAIAAAVKTANPETLVLAALGHSGGQGTSHWSQRELWAPSAVPEVASREVPKIMEVADIQAVVKGFGRATSIAVASGCHGVEVNVGQNSLIRQFLSGLTNMRGDDYGQDRSRFLREVLEEVRLHLQGRVLAVRLSVDELAPWAGIVPEAGAEIASSIADLVDLITVVRGSIYSVALTRPDTHVEPGFALGLARQVRVAVGGRAPVFAQGSIVDWGQAEWALNDGAADGVEMTRAQLADAQLVSKLKTDPSRIRPCLLCNQTCKVRDNRNPIVSCVMDPRTGHELQDRSDPDQSTAPNIIRALTIIGAGIAGLETARVAALRGFKVHVYEQERYVGGAIMSAANGAARDRLRKAVEWLHAECITLGVTIETNFRVDEAMLSNLRGTTHLVLATGAGHGTLPFEVAEHARVLHAIDVLRTPNDDALPEGPIAVWDPIGGPIAISVAESLAEHGRAVTLITPDLLVGEKLSLTGDLAPAQGRLHGAGIRLVKQALVRRVSAGCVEVEDRFSGATDVIDASVLVACGHRLPNLSLDPGETLPQVGDRVAPRSIYEAILEARRVAHALPLSVGLPVSVGASS